MKARQATKGRARGFTLVEMMVVIGIVGVLLTIAAPGFERMVQRSKVRKTSDLVVQVVQYAKSHALAKNTPVYVSVIGGNELCLHTKAKTDPTYDPLVPCDIRREQTAVPVSLADGTGTALPELAFSNIYGTPTPLVAVFNAASSHFSQAVRVNMLGLVTVGALT